MVEKRRAIGLRNAVNMQKKHKFFFFHRHDCHKIGSLGSIKQSFLGHWHDYMQIGSCEKYQPQEDLPQIITLKWNKSI